MSWLPSDDLRAKGWAKDRFGWVKDGAFYGPSAGCVGQFEGEG